MDTSYQRNKEKFLQIITSYNYSLYSLNKYKYYLKELEGYTENLFGGKYTTKVGESWILETSLVSKIRYRNRIVCMLNEIDNNKEIPRYKFYKTTKEKSISSKYYITIFNEYLKFLIRSNYQRTTIKRIKVDLIVFINYLENNGFQNFTQVNSICINDFISSYYYKYALSTQRNKISILKSFFKYLTDIKILNNISTNIFPNISNLPDHIPSIVSIKAQAVLDNIKEPTSEIEARDNAIILLTYKLCLRRSDAIKLKFSEIDWGNKTISIVQQKTLTPLRLPLPDIVGEALSNYICNFRNKLSNENTFIFLTVSHPIRPLNNSSSCLILKNFQKRHGLVNEIPGFHILRRTGVSLILNSGNSLEMVTKILGHTNIKSANYYINLDEEKMGYCKMNLSLVGFLEVLND